MVDFINLFYFIVAIVMILVVAQYTKNKGNNSISKRLSFPDNKIIDVEYTPIIDNSSSIKSENSKKRNRPEITEGNVFENVINFLNSNEVYFRYGKNKVEKDYQQDLEHKLALLNERFDYDIRYEAREGKHRVDFVIENTVGIEMKVHKGGTQVEKELFYQIPKYGRLYTKMIGLVLNNTETNNQELKNQIKMRLKDIDQNVLNEKNVEIIVKSIGFIQT
jgi:hypothetical protein